VRRLDDASAAAAASRVSEGRSGPAPAAMSETNAATCLQGGPPPPPPERTAAASASQPASRVAAMWPRQRSAAHRTRSFECVLAKPSIPAHAWSRAPGTSTAAAAAAAAAAGSVHAAISSSPRRSGTTSWISDRELRSGFQHFEQSLRSGFHFIGFKG
jgi:hypothetical protein